MTESQDRPPVSVGKRIALGLGGVVLLAVLGGAASWYWQRQANAASLAQMHAQLDAEEPGWRLADVVGGRPELAPSKNSAVVVVEVARLIPPRWLDHKVEERLTDVPAPELLHPAVLKPFTAEMDKVRDALVLARRLADMPDGRHTLVLPENPMQAILKDQQSTREVARLLRYDAWELAQKGDVRGALVSGRAGLNAARSLDDEPFLISQLVRIACVAVALSGVERTLAHGQAADADLVAVLKAIEREDAHPTFYVGVRGERAMQTVIFQGFRNGSISHRSLFGGGGLPGIPVGPGGDWRDWLMGLAGGDLSSQEMVCLEMMQRVIAMSRLPTHEQVAEEKLIEADVKALPRGAMLAKALLPAITKVNAACRRKQTLLRSMQALLAAERYRMKRGKWPEKVDDVVPEFLAAVPVDPWDGKPIRYRRVADGVVAYGIGEDGVDYGGALVTQSGSPMKKNHGYQLWDVEKRRQAGKAPAHGEPEG